MNRIWFGAVLLAVLLLLGLGSDALMKQTHHPISNDLLRASELALEGNWKSAENFTAAARREWDKKQLLTAMFSDHTPMDQIEGMFAQLEVFAGTGDAVSYSSTCRYLASRLEALGRSHSFNFQNLF